MADQIPKIEGADDSKVTTALDVRTKEMLYMELLEKRIADLETKLKEAEKVECFASHKGVSN